MSENDEKPGVFLSAMGCLSVIAIPLASLWHGYVYARLWEWFVVPHFGVATLPVAVAAGLSLLYSMLKSGYRGKDTTRSPKELISYSLGLMWLSPVFYLGLGWLLHWYGAR